MGPQKRPLPNSRTEPPTTNSAAAPASDEIDASSVDVCNVGSESTNLPGSSTSASSELRPQSKVGWHGGTWPRKSAASTQVARETILADKPKSTATATELARFEPKRLPIGQPQTEVEQAPNASGREAIVPAKQEDTANMPTVPGEGSRAQNETKSKDHQPSDDNSKAIGKSGSTSANASSTKDANSEVIHRPTATSTWRNWLGLLSSQQTSPQSSRDVNVESTRDHMKVSAESIAKITQPAVEQQKMPGDTASSRSWFGLWPVTATSIKMEDEPVQEDSVPVPDSFDPAAKGSSPSKPPGPPPSGSTWAFWSKDSSKSAGKPGSRDDQGELAVAGELSQRNPAPAHTEDIKKDKNANNDTSKQPKQAVRAEIASVTRNHVQNTDYQEVSSTPNTTVPKSAAPNLLLPPFRSTYSLKENPSFIQQVANFILHSRREQPKHIFITEPPRIKKALAIGIHGLFPAPLLRTVIGHPTGTSIRFANHAAAAIHRWADKQGYSCDSVEKIALEGEGKIAERVDNLWKLLLNWMDHVRSADFIMVACHSQGVPVALMLVAKLIEFGVVSTARIGVCAMAGVSLGPFADYKSRFFSGSAAELFDFANPQSEVAKRYQESLRMALNYGVRITYVGSIDDQLVSLESAIFSPVNHPYIYRAVFVDGRVHAPDFITHLVGFALKLRNLGVSDHGLIRELSVPLAGSLYSGGGHSSLYDETRIYDLAIEFTLETSSADDVSLAIQKYGLPTSSNPFQLPWSMRGLLEENLVKTELSLEMKELLEQFDQWKPATKVLKDVKYRLEAVKSKL